MKYTRLWEGSVEQLTFGEKSSGKELGGLHHRKCRRQKPHSFFICKSVNAALALGYLVAEAKTIRAKATILQHLKGQCHEIFCFWFFSWISFPPAPEYPIWTVSNFFENSRRYSKVKVHHRYQRHRRQICHRCKWHRWQIMGTISGCWDLKVNLKAKMFL
jgi:hypothetical protein